jgi:hypothetical protein
MVQGWPYDQNGHVEATYETFCKEPPINQFLRHWNSYLATSVFEEKMNIYQKFELVSHILAIFFLLLT